MHFTTVYVRLSATLSGRPAICIKYFHILGGGGRISIFWTIKFISDNLIRDTCISSSWTQYEKCHSCYWMYQPGQFNKTVLNLQSLLCVPLKGDWFSKIIPARYPKHHTDRYKNLTPNFHAFCRDGSGASWCSQKPKFSYGRYPLIRTLVIWTDNYPNPLGPSGEHFLTVFVLHPFMA